MLIGCGYWRLHRLLIFAYDVLSLNIDSMNVLAILFSINLCSDLNSIFPKIISRSSLNSSLQILHEMRLSLV